MFTVQLTKEKAGFGLGFHVSQFRGHVAVSHMGAVYGFTTSIMILPQQKLAAIVLSNADIAIGPVRRMNDAALGLLLEAKLGEPTPQPKPAAGAPADPAALAGQYESESYWATIEIREGKLAGNISGKAIVLVPDGKDTFLANGSLFFHEAVVFQRNAGGRVTGFTALGQKFHRVDPGHPAGIPEAWRRLLGSYGPEFIPLVISARHGHLYAMTENMADYRLTPVGPMVFEFPTGMYVDEHLVFQAGPDGRVHSAILANMVLPRRP
jgi:D-alanyl-D-alanine dipeptidase